VMPELCFKKEAPPYERLCRDVSFIKYCKEKIEVTNICVPVTDMDLESAWKRLKLVLEGLAQQELKEKE